MVQAWSKLGVIDKRVSGAARSSNFSASVTSFTVTEGSTFNACGPCNQGSTKFHKREDEPDKILTKTRFLRQYMSNLVTENENFHS